MKVVFGKCADSLLIDHELIGEGDGTMELGGWGSLYEEIILLHPFESRFGIGNLRMALGKPQAHVNDLKWLLPRKLHGLGRIGDDGVSARSESQNPQLEIESQQNCSFRFKFHLASLLVFSMTSKITAMPSSSFFWSLGERVSIAPTYFSAAFRRTRPVSAAPFGVRL